MVKSKSPTHRTRFCREVYFALLLIPGLHVAEPLVTPWDIGISGRYARLYGTDADEAAGNAVTAWNPSSCKQSRTL